jgi:hypothetical protein
VSIRTAIRDFFIEYEHVPDNVIYLNTPFARDHARANAAQASVSLEEDREAVRRDELRRDLGRQRRELQEQLDGVDHALEELEPSHV